MQLQKVAHFKSLSNMGDKVNRPLRRRLVGRAVQQPESFGFRAETHLCQHKATLSLLSHHLLLYILLQQGLPCLMWYSSNIMPCACINDAASVFTFMQRVAEEASMCDRVPSTAAAMTQLAITA